MRIGSTAINNIRIGSTPITRIIQNGITYWDTSLPTTTTAPTTTSAYSPTYYVSNAGSDSANGLSPATAWATLNKVNTTNLQPGNVVAFRAGDTWRGELEIQQGSSGSGNRITYTRYGTGANPRILGSVKASSWTATAYANRWVSATNVPINPDGYAPGFSASGNIFFEVAGTYTRWGWFRTYTSNLSNLTQEYDWTWNNGTLYVYSPTDPDTRYISVEAEQETFCASTPNDQASYFTVDGIDLLYAKGAGYHAGYPEAAGQTDITFRNCYIGYIGAKGQSFAYGIEAFHSNLLVENCTITDCGRRGISYNFYNATNVGTMTNVIVRNNVFKRGQHTTSLDLAWAVSDDMADVNGIYFYNNIVDDSDVEMRGDDEFSNQIYIEGWSTNTYNLYIVNNLFIKSTARNILISGANNPHIWNNTIFGHNVRQIPNPYANVSLNSNTVNKLINIDFRNNIVHNDLSINTLDSYGLFAEYAPTTFQYIDYNVYWQDEVETDKAIIGYHGDYYNRNQWSAWRSAQPAFDSHSPTPAEPQFTNKVNFDLTLTPSSPATGNGAVLPLISVTDAHGRTEIINQYDFAGNVRSRTSPSIGAYEYGSVVTTTLPPVPDTIAPTVTSFSIPTSATSLTINITTFIATDDIGITGYLLTETSSTPSAGSGPWSVNAPTTYTFSSLGTKTLYAWAKDAAGNVSTSLNDTITVSDTVAPTISAVASSSVTNVAATITWTTNEGATSLVEYGLNTSYGSSASWNTYVTSHSITLTGLTLNTTYHYRVTSVDAATNSSTSTDYTFTTTATAYGSEYTLVYNAMSTKPTGTYADAQNTLVSTLVTAGIWAKLDLFYLFAQNNTANAVLNWMAPTGDDNITVSGTPTFTAYQGYTGAANAYLNTNWSPSAERVHFAQNDASVFYYSRSNSTGTPCAFGSYQTGVAGIYDVSTRNGSISYQQLNSIGTNNVTATFGASGFYVYNRSASSGFNLYQNNVDIGSSTFLYTSSGIPSLNLYVLAANEDGAANNFWLGQMSAFGLGSNLNTTERSTLQNAIEAYMDTIGAGVIA